MPFLSTVSSYAYEDIHFDYTTCGFLNSAQCSYLAINNGGLTSFSHMHMHFIPFEVRTSNHFVVAVKCFLTYLL